MLNEVHLIDCIEFMRGVPDKFYDLAIVDPPNGTGDEITSGGTWSKKYTEKDSIWNNKIPNKNYFNELFRISKNQIIWCAIFYQEYLYSNKGWIVWRKKTISENFSMAMAELAWSSFDINAKLYESLPEKKNRWHPSQKPVALYKWLLKNYAKPGWKIFDSHVGSGPSRIACYDMGFDFAGCEIDVDYWQAQEERFKNHITQQELFDKKEIQQMIFKEETK